MFAKDRVHILRQDATRRQLVAVARFSQKRLAPELSRRTFNRLLEREVLEGVQRVVMDEDADGALRWEQRRKRVDHARQRMVRRMWLVKGVTHRHRESDFTS